MFKYRKSESTSSLMINFVGTKFIYKLSRCHVRSENTFNKNVHGEFWKSLISWPVQYLFQRWEDDEVSGGEPVTPFILYFQKNSGLLWADTRTWGVHVLSCLQVLYLFWTRWNGVKLFVRFSLLFFSHSWWIFRDMLPKKQTYPMT